jgi:hypothetical protein
MSHDRSHNSCVGLVPPYSLIKYSVASSSSLETDDTGEDDNGHNTDSQLTPSKDSSSRIITFESLFPSMRQVYGVEIKHPKESDIRMYTRYVMLQLDKMTCLKQNLGLS